MKHIYLDYNASAPLIPEAWKAMDSVFRTDNAAHNASAIHSFGRQGRKLIENARKHVANLIGADTNQIIFNSGATEGNNTILRHFANNYPDETILISAIEHPSILESIDIMDNVKVIPVNGNGMIRMDALEKMLSANNIKVSLISCMFVNNETGVIQNISELSALAHKYGALFHCDATQAVGRIPVDIKQCGIDFLTLSSHKIGGPQGVGALALGLCGQSPTLLFGGGQEKSLRAGTENIAGITGFGAAANAALNNFDNYQDLAQLRDTLEKKIKEISPDVIIHCENSARVSNTSFFSLPGANAQSLLMALDLENIALSNGSACSSGTVKPSITLKAMGLKKEITSSALRVSMGWATKEDDIKGFLCAWEKISARIKK